MLNAIALRVLVITDGHIDKTAMNLGYVVWVTGRDQLPKWLKVAIEHMDSAPDNSVDESIKNWDDESNSVSNFDQYSKSAEIFKNSRRRKCINNFP